MSSKDWLDGYNKGRESAINEITSVSMPHLINMDNTLSSTEETLKRIEVKQVSILQKIKNFLNKRD